VTPVLWWHSLGESDLPVGCRWLSPLETDRLRMMRFTKRRNEWLLSRWTGKQAIARTLGLPSDEASLARVEIRTIIGGPAQGAPEVYIDGDRAPVGVSLTDRAGWAVCTVGDLQSFGCDLELVEPRSDAFVNDFFTAGERSAVLQPVLAASPDLMANLIWSAKESALKVLRTGLRRDTRSVEVAVSSAAADGWGPLAVRAEEGLSFRGWWRRFDQFVLTVVAAIDLPPPRSLLEPPGLAEAVPSHSWMAAPIVRPGTHLDSVVDDRS
jgi:4'-phosphopantetheinyl transferase